MAIRAWTGKRKQRTRAGTHAVLPSSRRAKANVTILRSPPATNTQSGLSPLRVALPRRTSIDRRRLADDLSGGDSVSAKYIFLLVLQSHGRQYTVKEPILREFGKRLTTSGRRICNWKVV